MLTFLWQEKTSQFSTQEFLETDPTSALQSEVTSLLIRMINLYEKAGKQDTAAHSDIFNL